MEQLSPILPLVEKLEIVIRPSESHRRSKNYHKELLNILLNLPERFMDKKISIHAVSTKSCAAFDIDQFMTALEAYRKSLVFSEFDFNSLVPSSLQDCLNGLLLLFSKCEEVHLTNIHCKSDTIFEPDHAIKHKVETALFDKCSFEHLDLKLDSLIPVDNLRINWQYANKLFKFEQVKELCLTQSSYQ